MGDHHGRQTVGYQPSVRRQVVGHVHEFPAVDREGVVGVGGDGSMAGKVFGGSGHPGVPHAVHIGDSQLTHDVSTLVEGTGADGLVHPVIEVNHGCKRDIHAVRTQFRGHEPAGTPRELEASLGVLIKGMADQTGRWKA